MSKFATAFMLLSGLWSVASMNPASASTPTLVQYKSYQTSGTNGESNSTVQFNTPTSAGDTIWVAVTLSDYAGVHTLSVTDSRGNTYTELNQENDGAPGSQTVAQFYATNISGDSGTPDIVTLSTGFENYRGIVVAEIGGTGPAPLVGHSGNIQDGLAAGSNNVTSGAISVASNQTPALLIALAMNTSGGSSDLGGSGYGGPTAGTGFTQIAQMWNWGVNLGTLETKVIASPENVAALFNAPDTDSFVTIAAVFMPASASLPTATISAASASIVSGGSTTLTWTSTNATSCAASGAWSGSESTAGSLTVSPTVSGTYTLICTNSDGSSAPVSAAVSVSPPIPSVTFTSSSASIAAGGSAVLSWSSSYASTCTASGSWSGSRAVSGTYSVSPAVTSTYALTCSNATGNSPAKSVTVAVQIPVAAAVSVPASFAASPTTIVSGGSSTLSWSSPTSGSCTASGGWFGTESNSGTMTVTPTATTTYTLACAGVPAKSVTVTVTAPTPTLVISANPASVVSGAHSTLTWSSANATACTASGAWSGSEAVSGALAVAPGASSTYTLTCSNSAGVSTSRSVTVSVTAVPAAPAASGPTLVQYNAYQTSGTNGESNSSVQFNKLTKAGDTIWVAATVSDYAGAHTLSVSDTQGNVFTRLDQENDGAPGYQSVAHFYAANIVGDSSTPDTVTIAWSYDNYKGVLITEIGGTTAAPLVGHRANIQDGLAAGSNNVTAGSISVGQAEAPALAVSLAMNTTGGSSDLGGSGYGGPLAGSGSTQVVQLWNWGLNLATLETAPIPAAASSAAAFNAPDTDSYVTVAAIFY